MIKKIFYFFFLTNLIFTSSHSKNDLYDKIDLFGEVLENVTKENVDDVDQGEMMDSAINGVLQSLDPYSAYMVLNYLKKCKQILKESLEV